MYSKFVVVPARSMAAHNKASKHGTVEELCQLLHDAHIETSVLSAGTRALVVTNPKDRHLCLESSPSCQWTVAARKRPEDGHLEVKDLIHASAKTLDSWKMRAIVQCSDEVGFRINESLHPNANGYRFYFKPLSDDAILLNTTAKRISIAAFDARDEVETRWVKAGEGLHLAVGSYTVLARDSIFAIRLVPRANCIRFIYDKPKTAPKRKQKHDAANHDSSGESSGLLRVVQDSDILDVQNGDDLVVMESAYKRPHTLRKICTLLDNEASNVIVAEDRATGQRMVVKTLKTKKDATPQDYINTIQNWEDEIKIQAALNHVSQYFKVDDSVTN